MNESIRFEPATHLPSSLSLDELLAMPEGQLGQLGGAKVSGTDYENRFLTGSVENLNPQQQHDVVGEDFQAELATLTPHVATADEAFEAALEHRHHGFDLNTIAVGEKVEA